MIRALILTTLSAFAVDAQTGISLCPSPLHPDTVQRILTVTGTGFTTTTTAVWQQNMIDALGPPTSLAVQFVSATKIRLIIPPTIGTQVGTNGIISVSTGPVTATASLTFNTSYNFVVCDLQPSEFTAQSNPIIFTLYGDNLYTGSLAVNGQTVQLTPQPGVTSATATVRGAWQPGPLSVQIGSSSVNTTGPTSFTLTVNPAPAITGASATRLYAGQSAVETVSVNAGTPGPNGFAWNLANAPSWISIQSSGPRTATLTIAPPATTASIPAAGQPLPPPVQIMVTDGSPGSPITSAPVDVQVTVDAIPDLTFTGLPNKLQPDQQYMMVQFGTNRATPLELKGQITLVSPTAQFVLGMNAGSVVNFDIAPNCVLPMCSAALTFPPATVSGSNCALPACSTALTLQAGTVSGPVAITVSVAPTAPQGAGAPPPVTFPETDLTQDQAPPHIDANNISVSQTNGGFTVCVPGYTNTREMKDVTFRFVAADGTTLATLSRSDAADFATWFTTQNTAAQGGFTLFQQFVVTGNVGAAAQVYVTMDNLVNGSGEIGPINLAGAPQCPVH